MALVGHLHYFAYTWKQEEKEEEKMQLFIWKQTFQNRSTLCSINAYELKSLFYAKWAYTSVQMLVHQMWSHNISEVRIGTVYKPGCHLRNLLRNLLHNLLRKLSVLGPVISMNFFVVNLLFTLKKQPYANNNDKNLVNLCW